MKTYDCNMKKRRWMFISLAISMYIFISLQMYILTSVSRQKAPHVEQIHSEPSNKIAVISVQLGRNDKYNWNYTGQLNKVYKQFAPGLNMTEYSMYINLLQTFKNACETFNITYLLGYGSVLGAFRYHGFVPWDDDIDCRVNVSQKYVLKKALNQITGHALLTLNNLPWKFFCKKFAVADRRKWKWPFIDISFFAENGTHVYDVTMEKPRHFDPRPDILPLEKGIFENMVMPVPHNMKAYLERKYNMKQPCKSNTWDHKRGKHPQIKSSRISCGKLFGVYPLVHRFRTDNISFEELRLGIKVLYRVERPNMKLLKP